MDKLVNNMKQNNKNTNYYGYYTKTQGEVDYSHKNTQTSETK